ncbi:MAG TPA: DHH family phosphoesterase [Nitrososphaerales archaeon]|nr:DHH family phosphoesterase [Nitrososphaerales archaeon]
MSNDARREKFPFVDPSKLRSAVVICHRNADADAYLSAYAVSALLRTISPECSVDVAAPEGMTTLTTKLSRKFPHPVVENGSEDYDLYVAVDVGDAELLKGWLGKIKRGRGRKVLIDHHPLRDTSIYDHLLVDERATSTGELVWALFGELGVKPEPRTAQALLEAVMFDSSHLSIAGEAGLRAAVGMIDAGADLHEARKDLRSEPDYGEVLAKLKGAQRIKILKAGDWVVATSMVGSFQAHVARSLLFLGADVAVVAGDTDDETRVSLRSTQKFHEATKIHLGTKVAEELGSALGGHGGGHSTAASFSCNVGEEEALKRTLKEIGSLLGISLAEVE